MGTPAENREALDTELDEAYKRLMPDDGEPAPEPKVEEKPPEPKVEEKPAEPPPEKKPEEKPTEPPPEKKPTEVEKANLDATEKASSATEPDDSLLVAGQDGQPRTIDTKVAPTSWRKGAAEKFAELPVEIRREIHKREDDMHRGLAEYKSRSDYAEAIHREFEPYGAFMHANNMNEVAVIKELMSAAWILRQGSPQQKAQLMLELGNNNGVDWNIAASLASGHQQIDPNIVELQRQNQELRSMYSERDSAEDARLQAESNAEVQEFFSDPKHEFADVLREDMARLIESGQADDLATAYDKAAWSNPAVRARLQAKQAEEVARTAAEKAAAAEQASGINVERGSTSAGAPPKSTLNEELSEAYDRLISA